MRDRQAWSQLPARGGRPCKARPAVFRRPPPVQKSVGVPQNRWGWGAGVFEHSSPPTNGAFCCLPHRQTPPGSHPRRGSKLSDVAARHPPPPAPAHLCVLLLFAYGAPARPAHAAAAAASGWQGSTARFRCAATFKPRTHPPPPITTMNSSRIQSARAELWAVRRTLQGRAESSRQPRGGKGKHRLLAIRKRRTPRTASRSGRGSMRERCDRRKCCLAVRMPTRSPREPRELATRALPRTCLDSFGCKGVVR